MVGRWVPVLVRVEHLEVVSRFLAELESDQAALNTETYEITDPTASRQSALISKRGLDSRPSWSLADLRRLAKGETTTTARWARAMDVCAEQPETYLPTSAIAERSGMKIAEWRDAPRKISRHLKANYPDVPKDQNGDPYWPLHAKSVPEHPGEVSWAITSEMAKLWKQARS